MGRSAQSGRNERCLPEKSAGAVEEFEMEGGGGLPVDFTSLHCHFRGYEGGGGTMWLIRGIMVFTLMFMI
jgi:hypothetical protein